MLVSMLHYGLTIVVLFCHCMQPDGYFFVAKIIIVIMSSWNATYIGSKTGPCHSPCIIYLCFSLQPYRFPYCVAFILSYLFMFLSSRTTNDSYYYYYYYYVVSFLRDSDNKRFFFFIHTCVRLALAPKRPLVFVLGAPLPPPPTMTHANGRLHPSPLCSRRMLGPARIFARLLPSTAPVTSLLL